MNHLGTKELETKRLILRQYTINDAYDYACIDSENGDVVWESPFSDEQTSDLKRVVERYSNLDFYWWTIVEKLTIKSLEVS